MVPGIFAMHARLCRLPMKRLVEPAVRAATRRLPALEHSRPISSPSSPRSSPRAPASPKIFAPEGQAAEGRGDIPQPRSRRDARMARGRWRAALPRRRYRPAPSSSKRARGGGYPAQDDLAAYRVERRAPLLWRHAGATVALNPPPAASGALIAFGLALSAGARRARAGSSTHSRCKEAMGRPTTARAEHGEGLAAKLANGVLARELRKAARHPAAYRGTTHISVIDARRQRRRGKPLERRGQRLHRRQCSASC